MKVRDKVDKQWITAKMSEMIDINPKEKLSKGTYAKKISMDKLQPFCRDVPEFEIAEFIGGTKFRNGDTIMARITPCLENGKTAMVNILEPDEIGFGSTEFIVFRAKEGCTDPDFVYYLIKSLIVREPAIKSMVGSSGRQRVQTEVLQNLVIPFPSLSEQRKIGGLLKTLDDKIALNTKINNNLMQQIQSLFSDWFVTFTPFGGNKPSSWNKTDIYAISKVIYGAPFASKAFNTERNGVPIIRIRDLKEQQFVTYTTETHPKGYLLKPGDVVVGMDGEFRPYIWGNDKAWLNQRVCVFENKRPNGKAFLYCVIKPLLYAIEQTQVGTTVIHIGKKDFDSFEFWLPEDCVLDKFDSLTNPMYQQIVFSLLENKKLMVLRDTLLPKLLSGEINVSDIEL